MEEGKKLIGQARMATDTLRVVCYAVTGTAIMTETDFNVTADTVWCNCYIGGDEGMIKYFKVSDFLDMPKAG